MKTRSVEHGFVKSDESDKPADRLKNNFEKESPDRWTSASRLAGIINYLGTAAEANI